MNSRSHDLFDRAKKLLPGGVNSPVRAFGSVGMEPLFIESAKDCYITDVDGNRYVDYVGSWGPMILGHTEPKILNAVSDTIKNGLSFGAPCELEVRLAKLICDMTGIDMVRMVNSGTEAVMSAIRLARGFTGKNKIIKFEGCYHGHTDSMLIKSGSGTMTMGIPGSSGVSEQTASDTLLAVYNDIQSVEKLFHDHGDDIAGIIIEPVAANMGVVLPNEGFLEFLRDITEKNGSLLIFDEVITGFRLAKGGAQKYFGISADIVTYGKIIGGGMPVGAYGGRREIMEMVAPLGSVYQAGTLSGNPVAMAAGIAGLEILDDNLDIYENINRLGERLADGFRSVAGKNGYPITVNNIGSLCCVFFTDCAVTNYDLANRSDTQKFAQYFKGMLNGGYYLAPSQFEAMFIGNKHTDEIVDQTIDQAEKVLKTIF